MSTTIQIKRSSTASAVPLSGDLAVGELAVNLADKRLFAKQADGTIIELSTNPTDLDAATLRIDGVEITASATELNSLDGLTATTAELNILDGVTATATEINKLDGFTGSTAELNLLDGVTATTAELNTLDGVTATTTELNYTDGVTSNIQTQLDSMVEKAGDTMTGDLSLGDNVKAKFGASDDLQIYHDGGNSWIKDTGTGNLRISASNYIQLQNDAGTQTMALFNDGGNVSLRYAGAEKLATTATGVDVTGTITADGLTVVGDINVSGGVYLGGTGAANKLDDYEEGVWTPTYGGSSTIGTGTYSFQEGKYTKVGNLVTLSGYFLSTSHTGTGNIIIRDLPFTVENGNGNYGCLVIGESFNLAKSTDTVLSGYVIPNTDRIQLRQISTTSPASTSHVAMDGNFTLLFSITYRTV